MPYKSPAYTINQCGQKIRRGKKYLFISLVNINLPCCCSCSNECLFNFKPNLVIMDIKKIKFDEFVNKVNDSSAKSAGKFSVSGFVGKSPSAGHIRVYSDHSLNQYMEVSAADVIHQEPLSAHGYSGSGSILWIAGGANISHGNDSYHYDPKNNYFKGDIADAFAKPTTRIPTYCCDGGRPTLTIASMCCPGPPTTAMRSMCCDGGLPTTGMRSMCCDGGLPTSAIRSMCCDGGKPTKTIASMCCPGPPTTGMRSFCCDGGRPTLTIASMCCPAPPTTAMRSMCCDGGLPTSGMRSMCCDGGLPTTGIRSMCCDGGLPTSGMRSYCCEMDFGITQTPTYTGCGVTQYCGTGGYNPYDM